MLVDLMAQEIPPVFVAVFIFAGMCGVLIIALFCRGLIGGFHSDVQYHTPCPELASDDRKQQGGRGVIAVDMTTTTSCAAV